MAKTLSGSHNPPVVQLSDVNESLPCRILQIWQLYLQQRTALVAAASSLQHLNTDTAGGYNTHQCPGLASLFRDVLASGRLHHTDDTCGMAAAAVHFLF
jgi:hypothetical protein